MNINEIINNYETPMYIYWREIIEQKYDDLKSCLFPSSTIYYSMKANPLIGICQILHEKGCGVEVASAGEMNVALKAGFDPGEIIFTSPGKTYKEIEYAIQNRIKVINIESYQEALIINEIARKEKYIMNIALRVNPALILNSAKIKMSGISSQFGIEEEEINDNFINKIKKLENVKIVGFQIYVGTQILNALEICNNTKSIIEIAIKLSRKFKIKLDYLNMGGGFGVPYFPNEKELNLVTLKEEMQKIYSFYLEDIKHTELIFESGRYLTAEAGVYVTKVLYKKCSKGTQYIICDGGSNFHAGSAFLGRFVRNNFPFHTIPDNDCKNVVNIVGPLCTPTDVIGQKVEVNCFLQSGDYVIIEKSGAYGLTYSPLKFLSHDTPLEVLIDGKKVYIMRERGTAEDCLLGQNFLAAVDNNGTV